MNILRGIPFGTIAIIILLVLILILLVRPSGLFGVDVQEKA